MKKRSYGLELELSDIDRRIDIPENLGEWEGPKINGYYHGAEIDIVNSNGVYSDPICETCKVGGEINMKPTKTIDEQMRNIKSVFSLFESIEVGCKSHFHIHVRDERFDDFESLKNLCLYTARNQEQLVKLCYYPDAVPKNISEDLYIYMIQDGGRLNSATVDDIEKCRSIDELKNLYNSTFYIRDNKVINSSSIRGAVNISNLINNKTIEFRCFRATKDFKLIENSLNFVDRYITEALNNSDIEPYIYSTDFAKPFIQYIDESTQHTKERGIKISHYTEI